MMYKFHTCQNGARLEVLKEWGIPSVKCKMSLCTCCIDFFFLSKSQQFIKEGVLLGKSVD